jgi:hypothetical protein
MGWVPCVEFTENYTNLRWVLSLIMQDSLAKTTRWQLLPSIMKFRKMRPPWIPRSKYGPSKWLVAKLQTYPHIMDWIESDRLFRSPRRWPGQVCKAFKWRLIPSPVEFGSVDMHRHFLTRGGTPLFEHILLLAYCYGFTVQDLSQILDISEDMIETHMFRGVARLFEVSPSFIVWATATDFHRSVLPNSWFERMGGKAHMLPSLQRSPFVLEKDALEFWVQSPRILTHLIYLTEKQPRLATTQRDHFLTEARDG